MLCIVFVRASVYGSRIQLDILIVILHPQFLLLRRPCGSWTLLISMDIKEEIFFPMIYFISSKVLFLDLRILGPYSPINIVHLVNLYVLNCLYVKFFNWYKCIYSDQVVYSWIIWMFISYKANCDQLLCIVFVRASVYEK